MFLINKPKENMNMSGARMYDVLNMPNVFQIIWGKKNKLFLYCLFKDA